MSDRALEMNAALLIEQEDDGGQLVQRRAGSRIAHQSGHGEAAAHGVRGAATRARAAMAPERRQRQPWRRWRPESGRQRRSSSRRRETPRTARPRRWPDPAAGRRSAAQPPALPRKLSFIGDFSTGNSPPLTAGLITTSEPRGFGVANVDTRAVAHGGVDRGSLTATASAAGSDSTDACGCGTGLGSSPTAAFSAATRASLLRPFVAIQRATPPRS